MILETVKIHYGKMGKLINKSDFDPKIHKLYKPTPEKQPESTRIKKPLPKKTVRKSAE